MNFAAALLNVVGSSTMIAVEFIILETLRMLVTLVSNKVTNLTPA